MIRSHRRHSACEEMSPIQPKKKHFMNGIIAVYELVRGAGQLQISAFAASSAFFMFLSLVPIILLICSIIPYTSLSQEMVLSIFDEYLGNLVPGNVAVLFDDIVQEIYSGSLLTLSVSAIATIWSAGKMFLALMRGLDNIHHDGLQNYFVARMKACLYTVVMMAVIVFLLLVVVFGSKIVSFITYYVPDIAPFLNWVLSFRFGFTLLGLVIVFTVIYTFVPKKKLKLTRQIPGALFSALLWIIFSWLFSAYVSYTDNFGAYGSLATIVIAMIWLYYCMYIFLMGAYLNVRRAGRRAA